MKPLNNPVPVNVEPPFPLASMGARPRPALLLATDGHGFATVRYTDQLRETVTAPVSRIQRTPKGI